MGPCSQAPELDMSRETSPEMFKRLCISHWLMDSKYMGTPLKCHLHRPEHTGEFSSSSEEMAYYLSLTVPMDPSSCL